MAVALFTFEIMFLEIYYTVYMQLIMQLAFVLKFIKLNEIILI